MADQRTEEEIWRTTHFATPPTSADNSPTTLIDPTPDNSRDLPVVARSGGVEPVVGKVRPVTWDEVDQAARKLADRHRGFGHRGIWGIPTGGSVVAPFVGRALGVPVVPTMAEASLIVDDLVDSGATIKRLAMTPVDGPYPPFFDTLFRKSHSPKNIGRGAVELSGWLVFEWEKATQPEDAVVRLLEFVGEDPQREGLRDTPARVCRAWREMTAGYGEDPSAILGTVFDEPYDEMVICRGIPFISNCEHHMAVFQGTVDIGYVPGPKGVVGLSKLARLVDCFARRLQIQERLTKQIADAIQQNLEALGVAVVVRAAHSCMSCRGVKKSGATMTTSSMLGVLRSDAAARTEFLSLCRG